MADKKPNFGVLEGVAVYAKIAQADNKYESKDTEYSIGVIVDEDAADAWESVYKKQPPKKIKASEFEEKYKFPCPIDGAKNVYQITLKKDAVVDGEEFMPEYRPKVFLDMNNGDRLDITESRLISNGSLVKVSYSISENKYGTFARLRNVLVEEDTFKEYESKGVASGDEFGSKAVTKEAPKASATSARKPKAVKEDVENESSEDMSDAPF